MSRGVPEGWRVGRLGDVCNSIRGVSYKPENLYPAASKNTAILLRSNNIQSNRLTFDDVQFVDISKVKETQRAQNGDIAICMSNGSRKLVGKNSTFANISSRDTFTVGAFCSLIRAKENAEGSYIAQLLQSNMFSNQVSFSLAGSAINNLKDSDIENYTFCFPPLPEQKKIAAILTSVDEVIENIQKQIDKLQDLKKAAMNELLTNRMYKNWAKIELDSLMKFRRGTTYTASELSDNPKNNPLYITMKSFNVNGGYSESGDKYYSSPYKKKQAVQQNELLIVNTDVTPTCQILGSPLLLPDKKCKDDVLFSHHVTAAAIQGDTDKVFLFYLLCSPPARSIIQSCGRGTTVKMLDMKELGKISFQIPPLSEQKKIGTILTSIDSQTNAAREKLCQIQSLKKSLMLDLLTGKVRVQKNDD